MGPCDLFPPSQVHLVLYPHQYERTFDYLILKENFLTNREDYECKYLEDCCLQLF